MEGVSGEAATRKSSVFILLLGANQEVIFVLVASFMVVINKRLEQLIGVLVLEQSSWEIHVLP